MLQIIPPGTNINFIGHRRLFGFISIGAVTLSILLLAIIGPNYGIDFKGGTNIIVRFTDEVSVSELTQLMRVQGFDDAVVQQFGSSGENQFLIETNRISVIDSEQEESIRQTLEEVLGTEGLLYEFNAEAGDRIEIRAPEGAFDHFADEDGEEAQQLRALGLAGLSLEEAYITQVLLQAGLSTANVRLIGNPRHRRFMIRLQEIQSNVELAIREHFGVERIPIEGLYVNVDSPDADMAEISSAIMAEMRNLGYPLPTVQVSDPERPKRLLVRISRTQTMEGEQAESIGAAIGAAIGELAEASILQRQRSVQRVETVGPRVGQQLRNQGIQAAILALFFILVYIGMRFSMRFAPGAVVALFHDVIITLGIFVIIQKELSLTVLAALLTIIGYSLNDTIVVFDRIRENLGILKSKNLESVVNQSINETLSRTLLTSLTTLTVVLVIYILGGGLIQAFALAMIIGVLVGTYSSVFVASPIMIAIHQHLEARSLKEKDDDQGPRYQKREKKA